MKKMLQTVAKFKPTQVKVVRCRISLFLLWAFRVGVFDLIVEYFGVR